MGVTRHEIRTVMLENIAYLCKYYPLEFKVGIKILLGNNGGMAQEVAIELYEHFPNLHIHVECACWVGTEDYASTLILDQWDTQTGDNISHEVANLNSLEDMLHYLEKSVQLFGIEKTE